MRPPEATGRHRSRPSGLPALGLVVLLAAVLAVALAVPSTGPSAGAAHQPSVSPAAVPASPPAPDWPAVVRELMQRRADAYARGSPAALVGVHRAGSASLTADRALLRSWSARGLRVNDAVVRVAGVRPLHRRAGRVVLRVVHRLGAAVAVGHDGARRALPRDRPQAHRVVLVRTAGGWRIAAVSG